MPEHDEERERRVSPGEPSELKGPEHCVIKPLEHRNSAPISTDDLSEPERRLVFAMREISHGRIEHLRVEHGQPQLNPWPLTVRDVRFGLSVPTAPRTANVDFELKARVVELIRHIRSMETGEIRTLRIRGGLPAGMELLLANGRDTGGQVHE